MVNKIVFVVFWGEGGGGINLNCLYGAGYPAIRKNRDSRENDGEKILMEKSGNLIKRKISGNFTSETKKYENLLNISLFF
jgi:hypothetical protein